MTSKKGKQFSDLPDPLIDLVAGCFHALSDPTRLKMLRELKNGEKSVQELVGQFSCSQPNISRHLAILSDAGLVKKVRRGPFVLYSIANPGVFGLCENVCQHVNKVLEIYNPKS